jgi:hypothetical protein
MPFIKGQKRQNLVGKIPSRQSRAFKKDDAHGILIQ